MPSDGFFRNLVRTFQKKPPDLAEQPPTPKLDFILGAEPREKLDPWWWLVAAVFVLLVLLMALKPDPYWDIFLFVRDGLAITVELTVISFVFIDEFEFFFDHANKLFGFYGFGEVGVCACFDDFYSVSEVGEACGYDFCGFGHCFRGEEQ